MQVSVAILSLVIFAIKKILNCCVSKLINHPSISPIRDGIILLKTQSSIDK